MTMNIPLAYTVAEACSVNKHSYFLSNPITSDCYYGQNRKPWSFKPYQIMAFNITPKRWCERGCYGANCRAVDRDKGPYG
jgi:hypothetical protein